MSQTSLDSFISEYKTEEVKPPRAESAKAEVAEAATPAKAVWECGCEKFRRCEKLHHGALYLYRYNGEWRALADMDHVYSKCIRGLVENIRRLYQLFLKAMEKGLKPVVIGKAFDDTLYIYVYEPSKELKVEVDGFTVSVYQLSDLEFFERSNSYMDRVSREVIEEALRPFGAWP